PIILLSGFYSIIIGVIAIISSVSLGESIDMYMGLNFIGTVIVSFIYTFVVSSVGYKLNIFDDIEEA
ncbi:MAG: hypothetical protein ACRDD7_06240, partial [Peptostreptococcaceae bacterium]